jgi:diguanylate cyclase (GGDEF)-like protein
MATPYANAPSNRNDVSISGYKIIELLHTSERSLIYRVRSQQDDSPAIAKIPNKPFPSFQETAQFKREYAIAARCNHTGIVRPHSLRQEDGRWTMIAEDIGGSSLDKLLGERRAHGDASWRAPAASQQRPLPLADFFEIALQLCAALEAVHGHGVIHKDINPSNLVWNGRQRRLQLIDFGIACELAQENQRPGYPGSLEGTLRYMAPEQTGRMNRSVDYRADYYAVGATFYELLTGQPPFDAPDPMTLLHCHIARTPDWTLPLLANLPGPLLAILQRLLAKNAEQRYQSAQGLRNDLEMCMALEREPAGAHARPLGLSDHSGKLLIPQNLYGRENDIAALLAAFERSASGTAGMVLVVGDPGSGKSALIHEVHKPIAARQASFVSGKCDQYRRDTPYASLIVAFQELIRQLLREPEASLQQWAASLRASLGAGLAVMVDLIPELAPIVGATESLPALPPLESQNRLNRVFQQFVQVLSSAAHPLVLVLDDLQWADAPTLKMIELFMREPDGRHLLLIGAYRDNEVDDAHPLTALLGRLADAGVRCDTLAVRPLEQHHAGQLIADALHLSSADCAPLTRLCQQKTGGNPFFLNQFLLAIHEAGQLRYDFADHGWRWDMPALEAAAYTGNVVELMLVKVRRLPPATQRLLQLAASIGNRVRLETLALASGDSAFHTQQKLWPALVAGLMQPLDQYYKYLDEAQAATPVAYRFLHDRVQQAAYALASEGEQCETHLRIGRLLYRHAISHATEQALEEQLFSIVEQLNAGRPLMGDAEERLLLARLNLRAGLKARRASASQAALKHMRTGIALLPHDAWQRHAALCMDLQLGAAESAYLCGDFDAAEEIYAVVQSHCTTPLQKVRCISVQSYQYQLQGRLHDAIAILRSGLALLGFVIPADEAALLAKIDLLFAEDEQLCAGRDLADILHAGDMQDPVALSAIQLMQNLWMASYYAGQLSLSRTMVLSMARLSLQYGNSDFAPVAYAGYAYAIFTACAEDKERGYRFGEMALALARSHSNLPTRSLTCLLFAALTVHWNRPLRSSDALYGDALQWALDGGDFVQVGVVVAVRSTERMILGHYLPDLVQSTERDLALMRANGQADLSDCTIAGAVQPAKCLMGLTHSPGSYDDDSFSEAAYLGKYGASRLYVSYFMQGKIRNAFLFDSSDAEALASQADVVLQTMRGQAKVPETRFYAALIHLRALQRKPARQDASALLAHVDAALDDFGAWAAQGPVDFAARHLLLQAEQARYRQDLTLAMKRYQQAIDAARQAGYVNLQALGNELCGQFWLAQGQRSIASMFLHDALSHYRQWGADGKVAQLHAQHTALLGERHAHRGGGRGPPQAPASTRPHTHNRSGLNASLELAAIVKASQALSDEIGLRKVLQRMLAIVRENSGAQLARLLLLEDGIWRVEGEISDEGSAVLQSRELDLDATADPQFPLSILRYVARTTAEVIEDNIALSHPFAADVYVQARQLRSVMCLPIKQAGGLGGMLYLENNLADASFTAERADFLRMLAGQAMISISHARLHDSLEQRVAERTMQLEEANRKLAALSITDGLTGVANRRYFDEVLASECSRAQRTGRPLALILLDVDYFKKYNDFYGHQGGDDCLRRIAEALQGSVRRKGDLVARYGGEEFTIILPDTGASVASGIADNIRRSIDMLAIPHAHSPLQQLTISVGVTATAAGDLASARNLIRTADDALYRAKHEGRNRVVMLGFPDN